MMQNRDPDMNDLAALRARFDAALGAKEAIVWKAGAPEYPVAVGEFFRALNLPPWNHPGYDPAAHGTSLEGLDEASLNEVKSILTGWGRSERFSDGAWQVALEKAPISKVLDRAGELIHGSIGDPKLKMVPLNHPMVTVAGRMIWCWLGLTGFFVGLGLVVEFLRSQGFIPRGETPMPLYMLACLMMLGVIFNLVVDWRAKREFAAIRRGEYFARWTYEKGEAQMMITIDEGQREGKVKFLFWLPVIGLGLGALILGVIGAVVKGDWMLPLKAVGIGLGIGLGLGVLLSVPAHFMTGVKPRLTREMVAEVIFTREGFYRPGEFIPVMAYGKGMRLCIDDFDRGIGRGWLTFRLIQSSPNNPASKMSSIFKLLVPAGEEEQAKSLAHYYQNSEV